ncbi:hypothetical protein BDW59DRAFT_180080 [Aspergillus cavernicola]|uniref:Ribosomal RNA methyltransferase FtsJ domain-containing protein n=1 Tax=Aspergillus cavernicola TaxID=176166 RepID=A0ABR4IZT7_9EURO
MPHRLLNRETPSPPPLDCRAQRPTRVILEYLHEVPEFRQLSGLWKKKATDNRTVKYFYKMMKDIGYNMQQLTGAFRIKSPGPDKHSVLDMCMALSGFLATALRINPEARALGFSLPKSADVGLTDIPCDHPDARNFLPSQFGPGQRFVLVLCDGQVFRNHDRAAYREHKEAGRLTLTQLTLGLEHIKPGGTMIVLLHKVEALYTPTRTHAKLSFFYMLATNVRKIATFGMDNMYHKAFLEDRPDIEVLLKEFGPRLVELGKNVWDIQANALARSPFLGEGG